MSKKLDSDLENFLRLIKGAVDPNGFVEMHGINAAWDALVGEDVAEESVEEVSAEDEVAAEDGDEDLS